MHHAFTLFPPVRSLPLIILPCAACPSANLALCFNAVTWRPPLVSTVRPSFLPPSAPLSFPRCSSPCDISDLHWTLFPLVWQIWCVKAALLTCRWRITSGWIPHNENARRSDVVFVWEGAERPAIRLSQGARVFYHCLEGWTQFHRCRTINIPGCLGQLTNTLSNKMKLICSENKHTKNPIVQGNIMHLNYGLCKDIYCLFMSFLTHCSNAGTNVTLHSRKKQTKKKKCYISFLNI